MDGLENDLGQSIIGIGGSRQIGSYAGKARITNKVLKPTTQSPIKLLETLKSYIEAIDRNKNKLYYYHRPNSK